MPANLDPTRVLPLARLALAVYASPDACRKVGGDEGLPGFRWIENPDTNTQAAVLYDDRRLIVAFRGTEPGSARDWLSDLDIAMVPGPSLVDVHRGFLRSAMSILVGMEGLPEVMRAIGVQGRVITFTGHSLGGALANLCAFWLGVSTSIAVDILCTFGSPKAGSPEFARELDRLVIPGLHLRFVNNNDIVPRLPPAPRWRHAGREIYIDRKGRVVTGMTGWHAFRDRIMGRLAGLPVGDGLRDHAMGEYLRLLEGAK